MAGFSKEIPTQVPSVVPGMHPHLKNVYDMHLSASKPASLAAAQTLSITYSLGFPEPFRIRTKRGFKLLYSRSSQIRCYLGGRVVRRTCLLTKTKAVVELKVKTISS